VLAYKDSPVIPRLENVDKMPISGYLLISE